MPTHRQVAAMATLETQQAFTWIPEETHTNPASVLYLTATPLPPLPSHLHRPPLRTTVFDGQLFRLATAWQNHSFSNDVDPSAPAGIRAPALAQKPLTEGGITKRVCVLNACTEVKPGGDWEGGVLGLGQEESLARRSNLVQCLLTTTTIDSSSAADANGVSGGNQSQPTIYPLAPTAGIYSPEVVVFREGHAGNYRWWDRDEWTAISVVSVAPIKRPKTDESRDRYAFSAEKLLMMEKMKTILRIAAWNGHVNLVLTGFGSVAPGGDPVGHDHVGAAAQDIPTDGGCRNPVLDVAEMWAQLLLEEEEFRGWFDNVLFAIGGDTDRERKVYLRFFG